MTPDPPVPNHRKVPRFPLAHAFCRHLCRLILYVLLASSLLFGRRAFADEPETVFFAPDKCSNATCSADGRSLAAILKPGVTLDAYVELPTGDAVGWHVLCGEYRTSGMDPLGAFMLDIDGPKASPRQSFQAASSWIPFRLFYQVSEAGAKYALHIIGDQTGTLVSGAGEVQLRNLKRVAYAMPDNKELLGNPDLSLGKVGELPASWGWDFFGRKGDYGLVADKSFQTGEQTLRITSANQKEGRTVQGLKLPMPGTGRLTFTVWGRSDDAQMTMVLYLISADYKWIKSINVPLSSSWQKHVLETEVPNASTAIYFSPRIDIQGNGKANVAGTSLKWTNKQVEVPLTVSGSKNLLPNPDMELGLNGWMFDYYMPDNAPVDAVRQIRSESSRIMPGAGVDGGDAMLVAPRNCLVSACIPIVPGKSYTISGYFKATKPGTSATLHFLDPGWQIYSKGFENIPTDQWQRCSMTITWDKPSNQKKAYVRIDTAMACLLVDRLQVEEGTLTAYESPPVMVGVLGTRNVFAPGEEITGLSARVLVRPGTPHPAKLGVRVKDVWGREVQRLTLSVPVGQGESILLKGLRSQQLGVFGLELMAVDGAGKLLGRAESRYAVTAAAECPRSPGGLPIFGVCYESSMPLWEDALNVPLFQQMGARMNRLFLATDLLTDASYRSAFQDQLKLQTDYGIKTIIGNLDLPRSLHKALEGQDKPSEAVLQEWAAFVKSVVQPMKGSLRYWEILNEVNIWSQPSGERSMKAEKYVPLLRTAYETIKGIDPSLQVVGFALAGADYDYLRAAMQLGAGKSMDIFAWHAYRDAPDMPDTYADLMKMKSLLKEQGFTGPMLNSEQYYSANLFGFHNHDEEVKRRYIVGEKDELWATGRIIQNYIHHAAAEVPWCCFCPGSNLLVYGGNDSHFIYSVYGGYNAATRMFNNAGPGQPLRSGGDSRAFFFPKAEGGPLLAMYTLLPEFNGHMKLNNNTPITAFDMNGNPIPAEVLSREGLPLQITPVYVRLPKDTSVEQAQKLLAQATINGLGDPFGMKLTLLPDGRLGVVLTNRMNQPTEGKVTLRDYPADWKFASDTVAFAPLTGGASMTVAFDGQVSIKLMSEYSLTAITSGQDKFTRKELRLSPLFAARTDHPTIGGELTQWKNWIPLGEDCLSTDFSPALPHTGAADLSARLALGWDKDGLTLAVDVTDDVAVFPTTLGDFNADSLQVYIDQKNNAEGPTALPDGDDVSYHISLTNGKPMAIVEKGIDGRYLGAANRTTGLDPDVITSIARQQHHTVYQIRFPSKCLPRVTWEAGTTLGFSILINDNDGKGRKVGLTLAPKGEEPFNKPYYYRTLMLR